MKYHAQAVNPVTFCNFRGASAQRIAGQGYLQGNTLESATDNPIYCGC
jgi:hypothetical protein